ncbi:MAG: NUDIX domain-containing protein [Magnetococcales bacterium]|nr:NUDIX domain-containing protein [Magnetococcales bacterium]
MEILFATDAKGRVIKSAERVALLQEMRDHLERCGEVPFAVPAVHVMLVTSTGRLRLVQRGDKPENPFRWDKTVGGHVNSTDPSLPRSVFDLNARREMAEEVGIDQVILAEDAIQYQRLLHAQQLDFNQQALIRLIDHDPWQASLRYDRQGKTWLKRGNIAVYAGVYDGPLRFVDGEAQASRDIAATELWEALRTTPWHYTDDMRVLLERYYFLLQSGLSPS